MCHLLVMRGPWNEASWLHKLHWRCKNNHVLKNCTWYKNFVALDTPKTGARSGETLLF